MIWQLLLKMYSTALANGLTPRPPLLKLAHSYQPLIGLISTQFPVCIGLGIGLPVYAYAAGPLPLRLGGRRGARAGRAGIPAKTRRARPHAPPGTRIRLPLAQKTARVQTSA